MRKLIVLVVLALTAAACGGTTDQVTEDTEATAAPTTTAAASTDPTTTAAATAPSESPEGDMADESETAEPAGPSFDGPPAPDFELALNDGSTFRLSDEQKPVYLVFWAEW